MAPLTYTIPSEMPPALIRWAETIDDDIPSVPEVPEAWLTPSQLSPLDSAQCRRAWRPD